MREIRLRHRLRGSFVVGAMGLLVAAPLATGCSLVFVDKPPPVAARKGGFTCTQSPAWPVTDIGLSLAGIGAALESGAHDHTMLPGFAAAAIFGISAAVGAHNANACNRALGHPYIPRAPTAQPDMMPEMPFGLAHAPEGPLDLGANPDNVAAPIVAPQHPPAGLVPEKPPIDQAGQ